MAIVIDQIVNISGTVAAVHSVASQERSDIVGQSKIITLLNHVSSLILKHTI